MKIIHNPFALAFMADILRLIENIYTLFFFYKNLFYKNVEAEIDPNFKNVLRTFLRLRVD